MNNAIDRIYKYLEINRIAPTNLEKKIGLSNGYLGTQRKRKANLGEKVMNKVIDYCLDINPEWLLTGKGSMLRQEKPQGPIAKQEVKQASCEPCKAKEQLIKVQEKTIIAQEESIIAQKESIKLLKEALQTCQEEKFLSPNFIPVPKRQPQEVVKKTEVEKKT